MNGIDQDLLAQDQRNDELIDQLIDMLKIQSDKGSAYIDVYAYVCTRAV